MEYEVTLQEQYQVLKRTLSNHYHFRTRYSLLEALDERLGGAGLPAEEVVRQSERAVRGAAKGRAGRLFKQGGPKQEGSLLQVRVPDQGHSFQ